LLRRLFVVAAGMKDDVTRSGEIATAGGGEQAFVAFAHQFFGLADEVDEIRRVNTQADVVRFASGFDLSAHLVADANALHPCDFEVIHAEFTDVANGGGCAAGGRGLWRSNRAETKRIRWFFVQATRSSVLSYSGDSGNSNILGLSP